MDGRGSTLHWNAGVLLGLTAALLGAAVLTGWILELPDLVRVVPGLIAMQPNTALSFIGGGAALALAGYHRREAVVVAAPAGFFGLGTLVQLGLGRDLGLDTLVLDPFMVEATAHPGRMAPNTALSFTLCFVALGLDAWQADAKRTPMVVGALGMLVTGVGAVAVLSYGMAIPVDHGWGGAVRMAPNTAAGMIVLGAGIALLGWERERARDVERLPYWGPAVAGVGVTVVTLMIWQLLVAQDNALAVASHSHSAVGRVMLAFGLTLAATLTAVLVLLEHAREHARQLTAANNSLSAEIERRIAGEKELARQAELLRMTNADLVQFAYVASHDLQEPLRMVTNYLQLLEMNLGDQLEAEPREYLGFAVDGARRMRDLIKGLLEYAGIGTSGEPFSIVDMGQASRDALANLKEAADRTRAVVTEDALPSVIGDRAALTSLFENLIGNAIKYGPSDGPPRIHVSARRDDGKWLFAVRDNGIGIERQYSERIFRIFQRLHGRGQYQGTGIGLAICKKIVEHNGGRIWVESHPGEGSTFFFTIPARF